MTIKDSSTWKEDFKTISIASSAILAIGTLILYAGYIFLTPNTPPKISDVKISQESDKIKVNYKRKDEDGPFIDGKPINKDKIEWTIDKQVMDIYKEKKEIPLPTTKDKKVEISCYVIGYDGINKTKKNNSNTLEYFLSSPVIPTDATDSNYQIAKGEDQQDQNRRGPKVTVLSWDQDVSHLAEDDPIRIAIERKRKDPSYNIVIQARVAGATGPKEHVKVPIRSYRTGKILGYEDSTTREKTYVDGYDPNKKPSSLQQNKPKKEVTLNLCVKDILNDNVISNASVNYDNNNVVTDGLGMSEIKIDSDRKNFFKLIINNSNYYPKVINAFMLNNNENYVAYLIPKSFDLQYYDEVARLNRGYNSKWGNVVINKDNFSSNVKDIISRAFNSTFLNCNFSNSSGPNNYILIKYDKNFEVAGRAATYYNLGVPVKGEITYRDLDDYTIYHEIAHIVYGSGNHTKKNSILNTSLNNLKTFTELDLQGFKINSRLIPGSRTPDINERK